MTYRPRRRWSTGWVPPAYYNMPYDNPQWTYPTQPNWFGPAVGHPLPMVDPYYAWARDQRPAQLNYGLRPPEPPLELNKLLGGRRSPTAIWDVSGDPSKVWRITSEGSRVPVPAQLLDRPATFPLARHMRISSESFPWETDITVREKGSMVTVRNAFEAIYEMLQEPLTIEEWRQESPVKRKAIFKAMLKRLERGSPVMRAAALRIDFLGDKTMFRGLKPAGPSEEEWLLSVGILRDLE